MAVRVLLLLGTLAALYGCGQASSPAENNNKPLTGGCVGPWRDFGSVNYSPDGQKIVLISRYFYDGAGSASATAAPGASPDETDYEICVVNADGTGMIRLTDSPENEYIAEWSPDGTKIAFVRSSDSTDENIFVMNADGSNETKLLDSAYVEGLTWSPDGREIAFAAHAKAEWLDGEVHKIHIMRADGSGTPRILTSDPAWQVAESPAWSPDAKWMAFHSERGTGPGIGDPGNIYAMNVSGEGGTNQWRQLTDDPANDYYPDWSPDGTEIVFNRRVAVPDRMMIYKVDADGSNETRLGRPGDFPTWSPDGKHIAYVGKDGIYKMNSDGSNPILIVDDTL